MVATSHSSSARRPASLRDNPPSASSPPNLLALEDGAESVPEPAPAPTPELPLVLHQILKGYQKKAMGSSTDEALQESMALILKEFFARANSSFHEAELKTKEQQALADELVQVKEQLANQVQRFFVRETTLTQELEANKRLHNKGQKYTTSLDKVVPLRAEVVGLKEEVAANKAKMASLEERSVTREVNLGRVEADLTEKTEALKKIKEELTEQAETFEKTKEELTAKTEALVKAEEEMTAQVEDFEKAKAELLDDAADAYAVGFEDALTHVIGKHPEMDTSPFATANHIVDGQIVPRRSQQKAT
ncbi:uncharacterized protein [Phaseolus vulgaris]|uniref:uncharacterized protein n=1 Tax=Phaseolus vulgaris TaxID=3885 RepID=UPI0035CC1E4A